jgi:hypothetical protein
VARRPVNRWYVVALLILVAAVAVAVVMPGIPGCPTGLNECGGFQLSPALVVLVGALLAGVLGFVGFTRSAR